MSAESSNDPKPLAAASKTPLQLLPPHFMACTAKALALGARKYGAWNWRKSKVEAMTYVGAIRRHLDAWVDGEDNDSESNESHLAHVAACIAILLDAGKQSTLADNRPNYSQSDNTR